MESQRKFLLCDYHYDPLDRLISDSHPDKPDRQRYYCQSKLATEIQGAIQHSIFQHADQLLAQQTREGGAVDATLLAVDQQRSVLHTLAESQRRQTITYSPYGLRSPENGLLSLLGFNGERLDPVTGHYLLGSYRGFNPVLLRFNSPDRLSPFGVGGLNCYAYCSGDPVNRSDPSGHMDYFFKKTIPKAKLSKRVPSASANSSVPRNHNMTHTVAPTSSEYRRVDSSSQTSIAERLKTLASQDDFTNLKERFPGDAAKDNAFLIALRQSRIDEMKIQEFRPGYSLESRQLHELLKLDGAERAFDEYKFADIQQGRIRKDLQAEAIRFDVELSEIQRVWGIVGWRK